MATILPDLIEKPKDDPSKPTPVLTGPTTAEPLPLSSPDVSTSTGLQTGVPFVPEDASVTTQLEKVTNTNSPLFTQARTRAAQVANRRGLLNSSLGVQAGEAAVFDVALPIASQQAAQIQQSNIQGGAIASSERIAASNVSSFEREKATAALAQFDTNFQNSFNSIATNKDLPSKTRASFLKHIGAIRDSNFNLVEQLYNIDLVWESTVV